MIPGLWMGPNDAAARAAYLRAREAGLSMLRSMVVGHVGSRKDLWAFAAEIARKVGCSVRTVMRAFAQASSLGLMRTARGKKDEVPPGANKPIPCGWSHRWIIGRGLAGAELQAAIGRARGAWLTRVAARKHVPAEVKANAERARDRPPPRRPPPGMTNAEWLAAELGELAERKSRDGPA